MGPSLMKMFGPGAGMFKAMCTHVGNLQQHLRKAGRACPIVMTLNTKGKMDSSMAMFELPEVSDNCARALMRGCGVFVEMQRIGKNVSLKTDRDGNNPFRKVRGMTAADALRKLRNPNCVTMIQAWADALHLEDKQVTEALAQG
jgi:hypothetical protein